MKNRYEIRGDVTAIFINSEKYGSMETLIDTVDLEKADSFPNTWYPNYSKLMDAFYIDGTAKVINGKYPHLRLHRFLMDNPVGLFIDHINHNTLDNRRSVNLRITTSSENQQNQLKANSASKSGVLGVSWHKISKKWQTKIVINGKGMHLGYYSDIEDAEKAVIEARVKHMPFSQENIA